MITQFEIREFRSVNLFTGSEVAALILKHKLDGWELYKYAREYIEPQNPMNLQMNKFAYVLKFRKRVVE